MTFSPLTLGLSQGLAGHAPSILPRVENFWWGGPKAVAALVPRSAGAGWGVPCSPDQGGGRRWPCLPPLLSRPVIQRGSGDHE